MLRNYLLVTLRNMMRNKAVSVIHIGGLGLGIAAFLFAVQSVSFEYSFDDFLSDRERILHVTTWNRDGDGTEAHWLTGVPAMYHSIKAQLPQVQYVSRYYAQNGREPYCVLTYHHSNGDDIFYNEPNARYVDPDFLKIFSFKVLSGSPDGQLDNPSSIVLTRSVAEKYFGDEDPIGKPLVVRTGGTETRQTSFNYKVAAVLEDIPANSSLQFDILLPFRNLEDHYYQDMRNIWYWTSFFTFIKTKEIEDPQAFGAIINALPPPEFRNSMLLWGVTHRFDTAPFNELHFMSGMVESNRDEVRTANKLYTHITGFVGLSILIVACVNYVNLTTARSLKRAREVGIRKVVGASRWQLTRQFLLDALMVNVIGYMLGLTLLQLIKPASVIWSRYMPEVLQGDNKFVMIAIGVLVLSTLISGLLPAFFMTNFDPSRALKGITLHSVSGRLLRKGLVVFQFVVSVGLIVFTFATFLQVNHLRSKERGFEGEQRIVIETVGTEDFDLSKYDLFKEKVVQHPKVISATGSMYIPGSDYIFPMTVSTRQAPDTEVMLFGNAVDYDFVRTMSVALKAGREFTEEYVTDEKVVILNESAVRKCGYKSNEEAIGQILRYYWFGKEGNMDLKIIGVIADFNMNSPGLSIKPGILMLRKTAHPYGEFRYNILHVAPGNLNETIDFLRMQWNNTFDRAPFSYTFLDINFERVFEQDNKTEAVAAISAVLSILIACMGLGGLVSFSVGQRVKEIGIRKVLGASASRILLMLSNDFVRLILIAVILAVPLAWFAVNQFLLTYEYRIDLSVWMFVVPCFTLLAIAVLTISYQTLKAATSNPVDALKYE